MILTVWLQKDTQLVSPKLITVKEYDPQLIAQEYFGKPYPGALSYAGDISHCVIYTEPEKIGTPEGSSQCWLYFPQNEREMKAAKKLFTIEPLPSHERRKLSVEGA